jgi:hypothetical protein
MRRVVPVWIDANNADNANQDKKFKHDPYEEWVQEHRAKLVWCVHTLVQHWVAKGCPAPKAKAPLTYGTWHGVLAGILECAGVYGMLRNQKAFKTTKNNDHNWKKIFAADLEKAFPDGFTAADVYAGSLPFSFADKWIYEHITLKSLDANAAIRQLSSIIEEHMEGESFKFGTKIKKLTQPAISSPRRWVWLEVEDVEEGQ